MLLNLPAARITKGSIFELISEVPYDYSLDFHSFATFSNLLLNPWWLKSKVQARYLKVLKVLIVSH